MMKEKRRNNLFAARIFLKTSFHKNEGFLLVILVSISNAPLKKLFLVTKSG